MRPIFLLLVLGLAACREEIAQAVDPVALTPDAVGHFCQMNLTEHEGPKAQVHLEGLPGAPLFFSQVRDAVAYTRLPEQTHTILAVWVNDMGAAGAQWSEPGATNWIALEDAHLVVGSTRDGGMGAPELVPFSDPAAAEAFRADNGGTVMRVAQIPDEAVMAPVSDGAEAEDDSDFKRRLKALSERSGG
ncbi:nitrous oxide reductase accessory protein NosL [Thalassococcus sp. CAU 1522]|uniref:Nitrous oxide reductase accessory protein NosL n=1 Tax=Thalassococcus arenae TaxID=2851652 RepID=A0ABS6NC38_9RHOB|nr:nitrous oxide reductase accessory protein NosL [Thalassococcus arenae]MBV2361585.1 nitrous oxide reductase accessory protein NosL [Thalassococcus arenae]